MTNLGPKEILESFPAKYYVINKDTKKILQTNDGKIDSGSTCHDYLFNKPTACTQRKNKCRCETLTYCGEEIEFVTEQRGEKASRFIKTKMVLVTDDTVIASLTDVTETINTEKKLEINNQRLHDAEKLAKFGYWEYNLLENKMYASEGAKSIYGWSKKEFTLEEIRQCAIPAYRAKLNLAFYNTIENNAPYNIQFEVQRMSDKETRRIHSIGEYNPDKQIVFGVIHDITDTWKAQRQLKESENNLNLLFENMNSAFAFHEIITDENGTPIDYRYLNVNTKFEEIIGVKRETILGKTFTEVFPGIDHSWIERYGKVALNGESISFTAHWELLDKHLQISAYSSRKGYFAEVFNDVSDIVKSEKALHESLSDLNFTQHIAKIGSWKYDPATKTPSWSKETDRIFEGALLPGLAINQSLEDLVNDNLSDFRKLIDEAIATGKSFDYVLKPRFPNEEKWLEIICQPEENRGPEGHTLRGSVQDITEAKKTENELRQTNQLLRTLINNIPDAIYMKDIGLRKIIANQGDAINCGFNEVDEILGKTDVELYPEDVAKAYMEDDKKVIEKNVPIINREELLPGNNNPRWILTSKIPLKDNDNKMVGLVGIGRDITDLKLHQLKLGLLQQTIEQIPLTVVITDTDGNIEYVNPGFTLSTGYTIEEAIGKNPRILQSGNHPKSYYTEIWETILSGKNWYGEFHNKRKDGSLFWESVVIAPICNESGEIKNFVAIKEDVTEKKQLIRELQVAKEQAEESDRLKTLFLANMSHEIRTPLNGILGFSSLVCSGNHDEDKLHYFGEIIENSGQRLLTVIDDIIDIAMIQSNQLKLNFETFSINHLLKELYFLYANQYKTKLQKIAFDVEYCKNESENWVYSDKNRVFQILKNLLENAFKFTKTGFIKLACSEADNDQLTISVEDTGIGIQESKLDIIFQSFRQAEEGNSRKYEGTGLGLAIVSGIVEKLDGEIHVNSTFGKGTSFYVTLPRNEKKVDTSLQPRTKSGNVPANETVAKTIVSFEDDKVSAEYLKNAVQLLGYQLVNFTSPLQGIEYLKSNEADLVLMDVQLPEMNGYEATKIIKTHFPELPVLMQTAYAMKGDRERAFQSGCDDYLAKPLSWDVLKAKIDKYLQQPA